MAVLGRRRVAPPEEPFLDVVHFHFGIADPAQHYHLPFKCESAQGSGRFR